MSCQGEGQLVCAVCLSFATAPPVHSACCLGMLERGSVDIQVMLGKVVEVVLTAEIASVQARPKSCFCQQPRCCVSQVAMCCLHTVILARARRSASRAQRSGWALPVCGLPRLLANLVSADGFVAAVRKPIHDGMQDLREGLDGLASRVRSANAAKCLRSCERRLSGACLPLGCAPWSVWSLSLGFQGLQSGAQLLSKFVPG